MFKKRISFQISHLKSLLNTESSCVTVVNNFKGNLSLLPFHLGYLKHAVKELLDNKISKYDPELNGIILGHNNIKVINSLRHTDSGSININYIADIYLFTPNVGQSLTGVINKKSKEHIGCLIHSAFNGSIPKPRSLGEDLNYWLRVHGSAQIGNELDFTVTKVDFTTRVPYISGLIVKKDSDCNEDEADSGICCQDSTEEGTAKIKKKKKKIKTNVDCFDNEDPGAENINYHDPSQISNLFDEEQQIKNPPRKTKRSHEFNTLNSPLSSEYVSKKIKKEKLSLESEDYYSQGTETLCENNDLLTYSLDKVKKERISPSPEKITDQQSSKSERKSSLKLKKIKKELSIEELRSNLLNDAIEEYSSPKSSSDLSSSEKDKKRKIKRESSVLFGNIPSTSKSFISDDLIDHSQDVTPKSSMKGHWDTNYKSKSKKRKRSASPITSDFEDISIKRHKKKKKKIDLDELTNQMLAESLSRLK